MLWFILLPRITEAVRQNSLKVTTLYFSSIINLFQGCFLPPFPKYCFYECVQALKTYHGKQIPKFPAYFMEEYLWASRCSWAWKVYICVAACRNRILKKLFSLLFSNYFLTIHEIISVCTVLTCIQWSTVSWVCVFLVWNTYIGAQIYMFTVYEYFPFLHHCT